LWCGAAAFCADAARVVVVVLEVAAPPQPETAAPIATLAAMITNGARLMAPLARSIDTSELRVQAPPRGNRSGVVRL
jgi:hypothetical protein